jgi:TolA-binding protein
VNVTKLSLPLMVLGPILAAVAGASGSWAMNKAQVDQVTERVAELRVSDQELQRRAQTAELRFQRLEIQLDTVQRSLERIERKLGTDR